MRPRRATVGRTRKPIRYTDSLWHQACCRAPFRAASVLGHASFTRHPEVSMDAKWLRNSFVYQIILVAVMAILFSLFQGNTQPNNRNISDVLAQVQKDVQSGITTDKLVVSGNKITADTTDGRMVTYKSDNDSILQLLHNSNIGYNQVQVEEQPPSQLNNWLG